MRWLHATPLVAPLFLTASSLLPLWAPGCSNGDDSSQLGTIEDASQPPPTKFEAGSNCASSADCETGLVCLFPVSACNALPVCVVQPTACTQVACSCLGEPIQVCGGYATNAVDPTSTCDGGIVPVEGGTDAAAPSTDGGVDAGIDSGPGDAAPGVDASDAATD
jgi:hypothetical protein